MMIGRIRRILRAAAGEPEPTRSIIDDMYNRDLPHITCMCSTHLTTCGMVDMSPVTGVEATYEHEDWCQSCLNQWLVGGCPRCLCNSETICDSCQQLKHEGTRQ